jgi:putative Flp pilus-assembly TadE/G-like protein
VSSTHSRRVRARTDSGQITAMLVLLGICLLLAIIAVTDISGSYLRRQSAASLADGAALSASDSAVAAGVYSRADAGYVDIDPAAASAAVRAYLQRVGAFAEYPGLDVQVRVDGHVVKVLLSMPYELPVTMPGVPTTTTIHGRAAAEVPIY